MSSSIVVNSLAVELLLRRHATGGLRGLTFCDSPFAIHKWLREFGARGRWRPQKFRWWGQARGLDFAYLPTFFPIST